MNILGIETSCDETSVAVLHNESILSNITYTQDVHAEYGGIVPEIASRAHLQKIEPLCRAALDNAQVSLGDIGLVSVTDSPGLAGALLVGMSFAMGLHAQYGTPITGVNHLEGHIFSAFLEHPGLTYPFLALVVSGGHTAIYRVTGFNAYECLGQTLDDAAGEAFDKVGKVLGFAYPAGRAIEKEALCCAGDHDIVFPVAAASRTGCDFSFSGLKTAVRYFIEERGEEYVRMHRPDICDAFQKAVVCSLVHALRNAARLSGCKRIVLVGGVACNGALRAEVADEFGRDVFYPRPALCTDNAAMIARAGLEKAQHDLLSFPRLDVTRRL
ncbi:MAG: tRNA (adenosine(37)-N6)-threonylcarbamoyltransferase complex transferase subunit TsaD [Chitinivibrionales bacterium]|nr:tRNA (adenosine(37)-N6)-threonylcarbamoyltransferase complex transferase subunit TsaD [Chitinivibrionales bacterium]